MRLGIMGGTFDPIHHGHLFVAEEARARFRLDKVLFVPNGQPPHKKGYVITPAHHRYNMVRLATRPNGAFECSDLETQRGGMSYTVDTLAQLRVRGTGRRTVLHHGRGCGRRYSELEASRRSDPVGHLYRGHAPRLRSEQPEVAPARRLTCSVSCCSVRTAIGISSTEIRSAARTGACRALHAAGRRPGIYSQTEVICKRRAGRPPRQRDTFACRRRRSVVILTDQTITNNAPAVFCRLRIRA